MLLPCDPGWVGAAEQSPLQPPGEKWRHVEERRRKTLLRTWSFVVVFSRALSLSQLPGAGCLRPRASRVRRATAWRPLRTMSAAAAAVGGPAAWKKDHLWQNLAGLGFEPEKAAAEAGRKLTSHTKLGVSMFDKPNSDAFHIVAYFLFTALNPSHAKEVFRFCWPPIDRKADAEFRKQCCEWLKRISDECGSSFPQVIGSLFLSPGGPKFVDLMYTFARFVAVQYIKTNSESSNKSFVESFNIKFQDPRKSFTRCHIGRTWFLQVLQKEDSLIRQYQENSQSLIKQIRDLNSQYIELQKLQKKNQNEEQRNISEKVQKVRLMWASVMETLTLLEKEREVVSSVITGHVGQYTLDGTGVAIKVPRLLLDRIEKQMYHLFIGNLYEAGKLNLLTVIRLLNEALKILKDERSCTDQTGLTADLNYIEREARVQKNTLSHVKQMRNKVKQEAIFIKQSNTEKQKEWNKKWEEFLNQAPFSLIKEETPALDLLPAMSPLSFDPASEEDYESSIFFRYPLSLPDTSKKHTQESFHWNDDDSVRTTDELVNRAAVLPVQSYTTSDSSSVTLVEKDVKAKTLKDKEQSLSKNKKKIKMDASQSLSAQKSRENCVLATPTLDPFKKEIDHLAEEVAKAVVSDSPQLCEGRDTELGNLINSLFSNPFLTRKQIPRTPENLTPEIRNSQREVFQDEVDPNIEVVQMDAVFSDQAHLSMNNFLSGSALSKSFLPEERGSPKLGPQENIGTSHLDPLTSKSAKISNKRIWEQNSECSVLQGDIEESSHTGSDLSAAAKKIDGIDGKEEQVNKKLDFSSASCKEQSWVHTTLLWNSEILNEISSNSKEAVHFDILHETLPEVADNLSFNSSYSTESGDETGQKSSVANEILIEDLVRKRSTTEERNLNFEAICSRFEALKKSMSEKKKASPQFSPATSLKDDSKLGCTKDNMETDDMFNSMGDLPALYMDNIKPALRMSFGERKSLSPLIKFSPEEQRRRSTKPKNIGEFLPYLKEEEHLDKRLESSSNLKTEDGAVAQLIEL
ncbi:HAUS augmin-like complex subunit 6 isoform X2 [Dromiciops gliroides]|uniref:HAUS augmin-like complex subunit 6 isoform X2 n=1 Tax=Dromiciops gliroides TaxID=33562 RepID=UPI001CC3D538|nr:HAUS augmin-like complex subunit 6 isoform X2 [Dromiciops gliroides]